MMKVISCHLIVNVFVLYPVVFILKRSCLTPHEVFLVRIKKQHFILVVYFFINWLDFMTFQNHRNATNLDEKNC